MALEKILTHKRVEVEARQRDRPLERILEGLASSSRSMVDALAKPRPSFILECKKASPSGGLIRPNFNVHEVTDAYALFADAISVLTDARFFQGSFEVLRAVRERVDQPLLCKDFVVDPYQVAEARFHGADAILLMLSVLDDASYRTCQRMADQFAMDVLTEVHNQDELRRAIDLGAKIIGINNRNLHTLETDLTTTETLASGVPSDRLVICESGISNHVDVVRLREQVDGFLVGSSLMAREKLHSAVRELVFGRTKVCGITLESTADLVWEEGACWGGLIFFKGSPRAVQAGRANAIQKGCRQLHWAGVFVDDRADAIARLANEIGLDAIQLHGHYDPSAINRIRAQVEPGTQIWSRWVPSGANQPPPQPPANVNKIICDPKSGMLHGGTGLTFDWSLIESMEQKQHLILAGGLSPENAASADALGVWALDVNSGVENAPGSKNPDKIRAFMDARRGMARKEAT